MYEVKVLIILLSMTSFGMVQSLTQISQSAFGQLRRVPQVKAQMDSGQGAGVDSSLYKTIIEKQLEHHLLMQKMLEASKEPAAPADNAAPAAGRRVNTHAHIEKRGPNDFLVLVNKLKDQFENYIPNDIFYAPKPCVNWFDGCNEKGLLPPSLTRLDYLPF